MITQHFTISIQQTKQILARYLFGLFLLETSSHLSTNKREVEYTQVKNLTRYKRKDLYLMRFRVSIM